MKKTKQTIWLAIVGDGYECTKVVGALTTKEKAEKIAKKSLKEYEGDFCEWYVQEIVLTD